MYSSTLSFTLTFDGDVWIMLRPRHFTANNNTVPIVLEARWFSVPGWMGAENSPYWGSIPGLSSQ